VAVVSKVNYMLCELGDLRELIVMATSKETICMASEREVLPYPLILLSNLVSDSSPSFKPLELIIFGPRLYNDKSLTKGPDMPTTFTNNPTKHSVLFAHQQNHH
jgi:hypothetical protein